MISIEKDQEVKDHSGYRVLAPSGEYDEIDLLECYHESAPTVAAGMFQAQCIKFGDFVYQQNDILTDKQVTALISKKRPEDVINNKSMIDGYKKRNRRVRIIGKRGVLKTDDMFDVSSTDLDAQQVLNRDTTPIKATLKETEDTTTKASTTPPTTTSTTTPPIATSTDPIIPPVATSTDPIIPPVSTSTDPIVPPTGTTTPPIDTSTTTTSTTTPTDTGTTTESVNPIDTLTSPVENIIDTATNTVSRINTVIKKITRARKGSTRG